MSGLSQPQANFNAALFNIIKDPGDASTIRVYQSPAYMRLKTSAAETRTLAVPTAPNLRLVLCLREDGGDLTLTVTNGFDQAGTTVITFDDAGDYVEFVSVDASTTTYEWRVVGANGVSIPSELLDLNGVADALILDADGDTTLSAPTDDQIDFEIGGADDFTMTANAFNVLTGSAIQGAVAGVKGLFAPVTAQQALSGAGAVNLTTYYTAVTNTGSDALTLADSTVIGQLKKVKMIVDPGTDSTLTFNTNATIVFADVGDYAILVWDGSDWIPIELGNDADGATAPVYTPAS